MDIKKSNFIEDHFKLSSFSKKLTTRMLVKSLRFCEFCPHRRENPPYSNQKCGYIEKSVNIIYELGSAHVKFNEWIEVNLLPFYSTSSVE